MIDVSLYQLVLVRGTRHLWPDWFRSLADQIERDPNHRGLYQVLADKCEEEGEQKLADVLRWMVKKPDVRVNDDTAQQHSVYYKKFRLSELPSVLMPFQTEIDSDETHGAAHDNSAIYRIAKLGEVIEKVKAML